MFGLALVLLVVISAVFSPWLAPYDPFEQKVWENPDLGLAPPSLAHPFGTDIYGRDMLSRVIYGSRISLSIGVAATAVSLLVGMPLGALAGYYGRWVDSLVTWLTNVILAFPFLMFVLAIVNFVPKPNITLIYVSIGLVSWPAIARLVRGQVLALKEMEFVEAGRALGVRELPLIFRHILPNSLAPVIVQATLNMGSVIMTEAALSYLGFGVQPPTPAWGYEISRGQEYLLAGQWWWAVFPGLAISITVLGFNLFGDGLRDALDPRMHQ